MLYSGSGDCIPLTIHTDPNRFRLDDYDTIRIGKTRVTLDTLVVQFQNGDTPEQIVQNFPTIELADIYAVKAYYPRHRDEVDEYIREGERKWEEFSRKHPEVTGEALKERIRARHQAGKIS